MHARLCVPGCCGLMCAGPSACWTERVCWAERVCRACCADACWVDACWAGLLGQCMLNRACSVDACWTDACWADACWTDACWADGLMRARPDACWSGPTRCLAIVWPPFAYEPRLLPHCNLASRWLPHHHLGRRSRTISAHRMRLVPVLGRAPGSERRSGPVRCEAYLDAMYMSRRLCVCGLTVCDIPRAGR